MKKIYFLLASAVLISSAATAQSVKYGIKIGGNMANWSKETATMQSASFSQSFGSVIGYQVGAFINLNVAGKVGIQPELLYSTQGSVQEANGAGFFSETTIKTSYVNLPVLFEYKPIGGLGLLIGPQLSYQISKKAERMSSSNSVVVTEKFDSDQLDEMAAEEGKKFNTTDVGAVFGAQYSISKVVIGARYNMGLISNFKIDNPNNDFEYKGPKNNSFVVSLGFHF